MSAGRTFRSERTGFALQRTLLEILPASPVLGLAGIVVGWDLLAWSALVPMALWYVAAIVTARANRHEDGSNVVLATLHAIFTPALTLSRSYLRAGLGHVRGIYDASAALAFVGMIWWFFHIENNPRQSTFRWLGGATLALAGFGVWRRVHGQQAAPPLFAKITFALEGWQHKRRRIDELSYENAIADHLETLGFDVAQGWRLDDGREADILVRPKGRIGAHDWRDVMIEMKAHLTKITERDRAMGQLETYAVTWPGAIVLMVCGDYRSDLLAPLHAKVSSLRAHGRSVALIVKGRATQ